MLDRDKDRELDDGLGSRPRWYQHAVRFLVGIRRVCGVDGFGEGRSTVLLPYIHIESCSVYVQQCPSK